MFAHHSLHANQIPPGVTLLSDVPCPSNDVIIRCLKLKWPCVYLMSLSKDQGILVSFSPVAPSHVS